MQSHVLLMRHSSLSFLSCLPVHSSPSVHHNQRSHSRHCMSRYIKSTDQPAFQEQSAGYGIPQSSSIPSSSTGVKPTRSEQQASSPHQVFTPSIRFTLLEEEAPKNERPFTPRGRTRSHPNSLLEGPSGWGEDSVGSSSFLQPMSAMRRHSGSSTKPRSVRSFSTSSTPVLAEDVSSLPLSVTRSRRRSSVGSGWGLESSGEHLNTQQPSFFDLGDFDNPAPNNSDISNCSRSESSSAPSVPSPTRSLSTESMGSSNSVPFEPPPPPPPSPWKQFTGIFTNRVIKRHLKFILALYLSSALTLVRPVASYLGPTPFLANVTVVFMHPARTVGSQLEVTVFSVIGALLATASILSCQLATAAYNRKYEVGEDTAAWAIEMIWFFVAIWIMTTLKARYAKLSCTFLIFTIANIFAHNKMVRLTSFDIHIYLTLIGPMMAGVGICLLVCIFCWPETASEGLGRALYESLDTSRTLLEVSTRSFLLHHKTIALPKSVLENAQAEVREAQKKLYSAYREARHEVTFSRTDPADYKEVRVVISALMRHLGSISLVVQNERLLMLGHPDRDDDDLLSGQTNDSEDSDSNTGDRLGKTDKGKRADLQDTQSLKAETHSPLPHQSSRRSLDGLDRTSDASEYCRKRTGADEVRRVRQLLLRAENSTGSMLKARQSQQEKNKDLTQSSENPQRNPSPISRTRRSRILSRRESRRKKRRSVTKRPYSSATVSPVSSRRSSEENSIKSAGLETSKSISNTALSLGTERLLSLENDLKSSSRADNPDIGQGVGDGLTAQQIREAAKQLKNEKKKQKKRLAKNEEKEAAARAMPPKEVAFGDRRLFISFLDIVREPLQRLSDSCCRVIVSMENEIVAELNVEQDRLERIRKRNAQREDIIRRADLNNGHPMKPTDTAGAASTVPEEATNVNSLAGPTPGSWPRVREIVKIKQRMLTQEELDYAEAVRGTKGNSDLGRKTTAPENKDEAAGSFRQGLRRRLSWISRRQGPTEDDYQPTIPGNGSSVKYLTDELEIFDTAEADGLRAFIADHPALDVGPREEIFLVFFFIFALREIARALLHLGRHIEKLQEVQQQQMEKEGRKRLRRKLWWPKVAGNFWQWFSWGSYAHTRGSEGYSGLVINSSKNLERGETRLVEDERVRIEAKAVKMTAAKAKKEEDAQLAEASANQEPSFSRLRRSMTISALFQSRRDPKDLELGLESQPQIQNGELVAEPLPLSKRLRSNTLMPYHIHQASVSLPSGDNVSSAQSLRQDRDRHIPYQDSGAIKDRRFTVVDIPEFGATRKKKHGSPPNIAAVNAGPRPRKIPVSLLQVSAKDDVDDQDDSEGDSASGGDGRFSSQSRRVLSSEPKKEHMTDKQQPRSKQRHTMLPAPPTRAHDFRAQKPKTIRYTIWEALQPFKSDEVKYGLKMAIALTFIGLWAWLGWDVAALATDRGEWAMMTVLAVLSPTIGATFRVCAVRILGTLVGVGWAMLTYLAYPQNPYVICAMMIVIAFAVVFFMLQSKYPVMGVIMMLSYSSVIFGVYNGTKDTIFEVSYKRTITVTIGILISVILNTMLWPVLARRELRKEIALLIGREGVLFAELVNKFLLEDPRPRSSSDSNKVRPASKREVLGGKQDMSGAVLGTAKDKNVPIVGPVECPSAQGSHRGEQPREGSSAEPSLLATGSERMVPENQYIPSLSSQGDQSSNKLHEEGEQSERDRYALDSDQLAFQHIEHQLQTKIIKIRELLELSASEPRLKEDFPMKLYEQIVQCCQNILDRMISMRMAAQLLSPEVRELVTGPMNYYRRDMVGALLLYFSVLSSSLASKTPLPPYLPSARMARLRVLYNVGEAITAHQAESGEDHYTYIYYYAFSSALEEVIEELELLAILIKPLVGITFLSSKDGYAYGTQGDQQSFRSAIGSSQIGIGPLEPAMNEETTNSPTDLASPQPAGLGYGGLGFGGINDRGIGPLDNPPLSPQDVTQQQLLDQQIKLQNQQQQQDQVQNPLGSNVYPGLTIEQRAPERATSPLPTRPADKRLQGLRIVTDPFDPLQTGPLAGSPVLTTSGAVAAAVALVGSNSGPIMSNRSTASPIPIMDECLLGSRHAQRYKDALQLAQEASGGDVLVLPPPMIDTPGTPEKEGVVSTSGLPQDSTLAVGSPLSPTMSLKKRLMQKLAPLSPLREHSPLSSSTETHAGLSVCPPLADDTDYEKEMDENR